MDIGKIQQVEIRNNLEFLRVIVREATFLRKLSQTNLILFSFKVDVVVCRDVQQQPSRIFNLSTTELTAFPKKVLPRKAQA